MMELLKESPQAHHLALIGDGEWRDEVRRKSREEKNISWLYFSDSPDRLADIYSAADLFVHAGDCETFGLVSLEAQACGTRVLAVRGGGLDEGLSKEDTLIMARDKSGKALAEAVEKIWDLEESEIERGLRRKNMEKYFSWNTTFLKLTTLYSELVQQTKPSNNTATNTQHESEDPALLTQ
jgi:alpha-1,6-mannosyltransferase